MPAGVIGLLVLLDPRLGLRNAISPAIWLFGSAANAGVVAGLYIAAKAQRGAATQAALLGLASGFGYGLTAAFIKGVTARFNASGGGGVLSSWQLYACGAAGLISTWLLQNAYHAGTLPAAQPAHTLAEPVAATLLVAF